MPLKIERALLVFLAAAAFRCAADTAWTVLPGTSASGRMLLQSCRDHSKINSEAVAWTECGIPALTVHDVEQAAFAGINAKGVAVVQMEGDPCRDQNPDLSPAVLTGSRGLVTILGECATAREAVARLRAAKFYGSWIFLIADAKEAHVAECSPGHFSTWQVPKNFCVYSGSWKLPGMDDASIADAKRASCLYQKEWGVRTALVRAMKGNRGKITVGNSVAVSRQSIADCRKFVDRKTDKDAPPVTAAVGDKYACAAALFEIDAEYPAVLSCAYLAAGHPRKVLYFPLPLGAAEQILKDKNFLRRIRAARYSPELEREFSAALAQARTEAKKHLAQGDEAAARRILAETVGRNLAKLAERHGGHEK